MSSNLALLTMVIVISSAAAQYYAPQQYDYAPAKYEFQYSVNDPYTYDIKSQQEERNGDYVKGVYELVEPDGSKRVVQYYDQGYGFQANVIKTPPSYRPY